MGTSWSSEDDNRSAPQRQQQQFGADVTSGPVKTGHRRKSLLGFITLKGNSNATLLKRIQKELAAKELFEACYQGDTNLARSLLLNSEHAAVSVNEKYKSRKHGQIAGYDFPNGWTCFMFAIWNGKVDTARMLVREFDANVDQRDEFGATALHKAVQTGDMAVVRFLCDECKAKLDIHDKPLGMTPLILAAKLCKYEIVEYFLQKGANLAAMNNLFETALVCAALSIGLVNEADRQRTINVIKKFENNADGKNE